MSKVETGMKFDSYEELQLFIRQFEESEFVQLWTFSSRSIEGARKRGLKRYLNDRLQYYEILYKCINGGKWKSRSTGKRPSQKTHRQECPFKLRLKASLDGNYLEVADFVAQHNHNHTKETYSCLPRQRQLDAPTKALAKHMLKLRANKKLRQTELLASSKAALKVLQNLSNSNDDTLENAINYLTQKDSGIVETLKNEDNTLLGVYYQDEEMRRAFSNYPEILFVDRINKISNKRMPLYIFAVEDGNGECEIVTFFLSTTENAATVRKMVQLFKKHNPEWQQTKTVMIDKDFTERSSFKEEFPDAALLICLFHVLRTFKIEIITEKMGITVGERDMCLELLQKMAYADDEPDYMDLLKQLEETNLKRVTEYFKHNWHDIRDEWVISLQRSVRLGNRTNNKLESLNSKVVQVVTRHSSLPTLFRDLDNLLLSFRTERDNIAAQTLLKIPLNVDIENDAQKQYLQLLTPYAYGLVAEKFRIRGRVNFDGEISDGDTLSVRSGAGLLSVSPERCNCPFFNTMELPCHHILRIRELKELNLFCESLVAARWTKSFYLSSCMLANKNEQPEQTACTADTACSTRILSQHEKFRLASEKARKLASLTSEAPSALFSQRMKVLDTLINLWENDREACVTSCNDDVENSSTQMPKVEVNCNDDIENSSFQMPKVEATFNFAIF